MPLYRPTKLVIVSCLAAEAPPPTPAPPPPPPTPAPPPPPATVTYNSIQYELYLTYRSWQDALQTCESSGRTLAVIDDLATETALLPLLSQAGWEHISSYK